MLLEVDIEESGRVLCHWSERNQSESAKKMYFIDSRLHGFPIGFGSRTYTSTSAAVKLECSKNDHVSPRIWKNLQESGRNSKWEHALWDPSNLDASKNPFACDRAATHCSLRHALHQIVYWEHTKRDPPFKHFLNEENKSCYEVKMNFKTPSNSYHEQLDLEHFSSNSQVDDLL